MTNTKRLLLSVALACFVSGTGRATVGDATVPSNAAILAPTVIPIDWSRFRRSVKETGDMVAARQILRNNARYNLDWTEKNFPYNAARNLYTVSSSGAQDGIRAPASAAYGLAVLLQTGAYDETITGVPQKEARRRVAALIKGVAASYAGTEKSPKGWGNQWQSALWAALLGQAGWMVWDNLDPEARSLITKCVTNEADRFIAPNYRVPYWTAPDGHVNTPGDSKGEENSWNAMILQVAVAMMPNHPHAADWKRIGSELMVSSFARQKDSENADLLDGKPVKEWLHGFNVSADGGLINHHILHPDYMATPIHNLRSYLVQSLARQTVPQTADFNAQSLYRTLAYQAWTSPPYEAPGGTMYQPGKAELYYPQKTDWSRFRFDIYYLMDAYSDHFGWDRGMPTKSRDWMWIRAQRMLAMQARFPTGQMYAPGEFDTYAGREQLVSWQMGDAVLLQWLTAQKALQKAGNWRVSR